MSNTHLYRRQVFIHKLYLYSNLHIHPNLEKYENTIHPRCYGIHSHVLVFPFLTFDVARINTGCLYWTVFQHMVVLYTSLEGSFFIPLDGPSHPPHLWSPHFVPKSQIIVQGTDEGWDFVPASFDEKSHLTAYDVTHPHRTHPQTTTLIYVRVVLVHCDKLQHAEEVFAKSFLIKSYHRRDEDLPLHFAKLLVELS
jgi:hypothetical protein